jgi:hypothetical protein
MQHLKTKGTFGNSQLKVWRVLGAQSVSLSFPVRARTKRFSHQKRPRPERTTRQDPQAAYREYPEQTQMAYGSPRPLPDPVSLVLPRKSLLLGD